MPRRYRSQRRTPSSQPARSAWLRSWCAAEWLPSSMPASSQRWRMGSRSSARSQFTKPVASTPREVRASRRRSVAAREKSPCGGPIQGRSSIVIARGTSSTGAPAGDGGTMRIRTSRRGFTLATSGEELGQGAALDVEEPLLAPQPPTVARQLSVATDDAVARDHDRDPVVAVRARDGADRVRASDTRSLFPIASRLAVGDCPQLGPHGFLERSPGSPQRHRERAPGPTEVLLQLRGSATEDLALARNEDRSQRAGDPFELGLEHPAVGELEEAQRVVGRPGEHGAERSGDPGQPDDGRLTAPA